MSVSRGTLKSVVAAGAIVLLGVFLPTVPASADVNDFSFVSFHGEYELGRDDDGHSTLTVVETLVAEFPETDQNRGIRRELVDTYDGHPTDLVVESVTDENGVARAFEAESDDGIEILTIAGDDYVHGEQTYVITYSQRNVTRYFENTDADEFYWDTNGTGWGQPFGEVSATIVLADGLSDALTGRAAAAFGLEGESKPVDIEQTDTGFEVSQSDLTAGENLSFAIGFEAGTFTPRDGSFGAAPWPALGLVGALLAVLAAIGAFILRRRRLGDAPGRGVIVPEYVPPKDTGILLSSVVSGRSTHTVAAEVLALAVDGRVRIVEVGETAVTKKPRFELEYVDADQPGATAERRRRPAGYDTATPDDREFLHALFGSTLTPGERRSLAKADSKVATRLAEVQKKVTAAATERGYRRPYPGGPVAAVIGGAVVAAGIAFVFSIMSLAQAYGGAWPVVTLIVGIVSLIVAVIAIARVPLEAPGVELRDYLKGLDEYIRLAEADRLAYLQSPKGADRTPIPTDDREAVLRLTERLLPWAVLFGREKEWTDELGRVYAESGVRPLWYTGTHPFNGAIFAASIGSITTSVSSTYSSSSGGSAGGVSSGGGGGGGGGGGV